MADLAQFNANQTKSEPRRRKSLRVVERKKKHVAGRGPTRGQQRPSRVATSNTGVAPLAPCPCFTGVE